MKRKQFTKSLEKTVTWLLMAHGPADVPEACFPAPLVSPLARRGRVKGWLLLSAGAHSAPHTQPEEILLTLSNHTAQVSSYPSFVFLATLHL